MALRRDAALGEVRKFVKELPSRPTLTLTPGAVVHGLVLGSSASDLTVIDLESGAMVRWRIAWPDQANPDLRPFEVVEARLSDEIDDDDLAQPEAVTVDGLPRQIGTLRGRIVRRMLERVTTPADGPLFGFRGPSAPYWEFRGDRPSIALINAERSPQLLRRREDDSTWVRFGWDRDDVWLLCEDPHATRALDAARRDSLVGKDLTTSLGFRPAYVLATLSAPTDGHCYKICTGLLPRS
ncbi:MAG: hypothetical protein WCG86_02425 [Actinomycetota bacterium]|jgi:hypothetical protein